jgi:hypothetical protein
MRFDRRSLAAAQPCSERGERHRDDWVGARRKCCARGASKLDVAGGEGKVDHVEQQGR